MLTKRTHGWEFWLQQHLKICLTKNRLKCYSPVKLVFGRDIILPIKHKVDWELICQRNQMQVNEDNVHKNGKIVYHD